MKDKRISRSSQLLLALICTTAAVWPSTAYAQAAPDEQATDAGIADIIVTASRRSVNIQNEAMSIRAISSDELTRANVTKLEDVSSLVPGVSITQGGAIPLVYIRGIGNFGTQSFYDPAVATNLDGVYIARGWATRGLFFDLERVEVLRGPQGTLYGRNATGGAINLITAKPKLGDMGGFGEIQIGNYGLKQGTAALNLPLGETLALRVAGQIIDRNGYLKDGSDDLESQSARIQLFWKPDENVSLLLSAGYQHLGGRGAGLDVKSPFAGEKWAGVGDPLVTAIIRAQPSTLPPNLPSTNPLLPAPEDTDAFIDQDVSYVTGELNWNMGFASLTVLGSYWHAKLQSLTSLIGLVSSENIIDKTTSLEVRLAHESDRFKWVVGGYYFNEDQDSLSGRPSLSTYQGISSAYTGPLDSNTRSYAGFGQATFSLTDQLRVTGGLRYTHERKLVDSLYWSRSLPNAAGLCAPPRVPSPAPADQPRLTCYLSFQFGGVLKYNNLTYKAGLEFDVAPSSMIYGNVSTGFRSGGFFNGPPPNTFRPEKLTAFEVGSKNRFLDNKLQVNAELFYYKYTDKQESYVAPNSIGTLTFITENAASAKSYGADLDIEFRPTRADEFGIKILYNIAKYSKFIYRHPTSRAGPPLVSCSVGPVVAGWQDVDCSGQQLIRAPRWSGNVSYGHTFDIGSAGALAARADVSFSSSYMTDIQFLPEQRQKAYAMGNFDLSYRPENGKWEISAYVRNIWNERVFNHVNRYFNLSNANPYVGANGFFTGPVRPPRTYGIRARVNF